MNIIIPKLNTLSNNKNNIKLHFVYLSKIILLLFKHLFALYIPSNTFKYDINMIYSPEKVMIIVTKYIYKKRKYYK